MTRQVVGEAVYNADLDTTGLQGGVRRAESGLKASAAQVERGFTAPTRSGIGGLVDRFDNLAKKGGAFGSVMQGLGLGAGVVGFQALSNAVAGTVQYLGNAIQAGRDETQAIGTMTQAIRANEAGWDGNVDAIERVIDARQQLGFSDDEQRASFQSLVSVTKDSSEALRVQRTAMDLARLKGIDLKTASELLGKVYAGNLGTLSRYGIILEEGATATEAMEEIQRRAAGQAESWADSEAGAAAVVGISMENLAEDIGRKLVPAADTLVRFVRDSVIPAFYFLLDVAGTVGTGIGNIANAFREAAGDVHYFAMNFGEQGDRVHAVADQMGLTFDELKDRVRDRMLETGEDFATAMDGIESELDAARLATRESSWEMMQGILSSVNNGGTEVEREFSRIAAMPASMMAAENDAIRDAAFQQQVSYAKGLIDGQNAPLVQMEALAQLQEEALTRSAEVARLKGQLHSTELAAGMASDIPAVRAQAEAARLAIINQLANLGEDARNWGNGIAQSMADGLNNGYGMVRTAAGGLAAAVRGQVGIESEPKDPRSPLRGVTRWGGNMVRTIVDDARSQLRLADALGADLARALTPNLGADVVGSRLAGSGSIHGDASRWTGTLTVRLEGATGAIPTETATAIGRGIGDALDASGLLGALRLEASVT